MTGRFGEQTQEKPAARPVYKPKGTAASYALHPENDSRLLVGSSSAVGEDVYAEAAPKKDGSFHTGFYTSTGKKLGSVENIKIIWLPGLEPSAFEHITISPGKQRLFQRRFIKNLIRYGGITRNVPVDTHSSDASFSGAVAPNAQRASITDTTDVGEPSGVKRKREHHGVSWDDLGKEADEEARLKSAEKVDGKEEQTQENVEKIAKEKGQLDANKGGSVREIQKGVEGHPFFDWLAAFQSTPEYIRDMESVRRLLS